MKNTRLRTANTRLPIAKIPNENAFRRSATVAQGTVNHPAPIRGRVAQPPRIPQQNEPGERAPSSPGAAITRSPIPLYAERARRIRGFFWLSES